MAKTAWPTTSELTSRLAGLGVTSLPTGLALQDQIDGAVEVLERLSGQVPFLLEANAAEFNLDPSRRTVLDLKSRWPDIDSVELDGETLTLNEDYWLKPFGGPYRWIEFRDAAVMTGEPQTVVVTGKRGYALTIPLAVWNAVLDYAAALVYQTAAMAGTVSAGNITEIQQDSVRIKYGSGQSGASAGGTAETLMSQAEAVFARYKSLAIGGLSCP